MSVRQQIVNAVTARFAGITITNGVAIGVPYETDIGAHQTEWHVTSFDPSQLDAVDVWDTIDTQLPDAEGKSSGLKPWALTIIANVVLAPAATNAAKARKAISDLKQAIAIDPTWGSIAKRTEEVSDEIKIAKDGTSVGGAQVIFKVITSRKPFTA
jgi:hypothetical protein